MKVCIDIDDYHSFPRYDCTDVMIKLIDEFPGIRFTVFFTPLMRGITLTDYPQALERLKEMVERGNVEVFPHGLTHNRFVRGELGWLSRRGAKKKLEQSTRLLDRARVPFGEGFKFPWNIYSRAALLVLEELNYILFTNRMEGRYRGRQVVWGSRCSVVRRYIQTEDYRYGRPGIQAGDAVLYYHGHAQNIRGNGIRESYRNIVAEFRELGEQFNVDFIFCSQLAEYCGS